MEELITEYKNSDALVFATTYEGFGLPIAEAQAIGLPVITSKMAPMTDTAGSAALFVDPYDERDIRAALKQLIYSPDLASRLSDLGMSNAERFDAKVVADKYADLYARILDELSLLPRCLFSGRGRDSSAWPSRTQGGHSVTLALRPILPGVAWLRATPPPSALR